MVGPVRIDDGFIRARCHKSRQWHSTVQGEDEFHFSDLLFELTGDFDGRLAAAGEFADAISKDITVGGCGGVLVAKARCALCADGADGNIRGGGRMGM